MMAWTKLLYILLCLPPAFYTFVWLFAVFDWSSLRPVIKETISRTRTPGIKRVAFWNSWFGDPHWPGIIAEGRGRMKLCPVKCEFYTNMTDPLQYDSLVFHGRDKHRQPKQRTADQIYIILMYESPANRGDFFIKSSRFYNWSASYHTQSEISIPYVSYMEKIWPNPADRHIPEMPSLSMLSRNTKRKLPILDMRNTSSSAIVAWVVTNCYTYSRREDYARHLSNYVKVDIFGGCGKHCFKNTKVSGSACYRAIANSGQYKFYLAFENSACKDYITEKPFKALEVGLVPVVYGALDTEDYRRHLPPKSFIDVRQFSSAKKLAAYLNYLDGNDTAYLEFHKWRQDYEFAKRDTMCTICKALHNTTLTSKKRNVNWDAFWNPAVQCDMHLYDKVKGE